MELNIVKFFNRLGQGSMDRMTRVISHIFLLAVFWATVAIWLLLFDEKKGKEIFVAMGAASVFHFAITEGIFKILLPKCFRGRRRPYIAYPQEIRAIGREHRDSSFPSSHMSATLAMLTVLVYFFPASWPLAIIATIFMAYARMHHGMHYPSDIIAGIVFGIGYGAGGVYASSIIISFIYS